MPSDIAQGHLSQSEILGDTPSMNVNTPVFGISREGFYESYKQFSMQAMALLNQDMEESEFSSSSVQGSLTMDALCADLVADKDRNVLRWLLDPTVQVVIDKTLALYQHGLKPNVSTLEWSPWMISSPWDESFMLAEIAFNFKLQDDPQKCW